MNRIRPFLASVAVAAVAALAAPWASAQTSQPEPLRIGYQKAASVFVLQKQQGTLEKRLAPLGVGVKWVEFPAGPQLLEGLNVGSIDLGYVGEAPPIFAQAAGAKFVYVGNDPASPEAEAIVVPKDSPIKSVAELKGKKVALNKGSNVHYLLVKALEKAGLKYGDVQTVFLPPADARAAFERGAVDAWVIWDPFLSAAEKQIGARALTNGRGLVDNNQFYLAERGYAERHPQVLSMLFEDLNERARWIGANLKPTAAARTLSCEGSIMKIFWFIPSHGDSRYLGTSVGARAGNFDYFKQVAIAADSLGYEGVLLPTGRSCEDSWVLASSLIDATKRLKFLVALRPGLVQPVQSARMAATFDRLSGGRLLVNLVTGGDPDELEGDGLFLLHGERYALSREFLTIWREVLRASHEQQPIDHDGAHLRVKGAKVLYPPINKPYPPVFFGGSSEEAHELAAEQLDTYLTWGEPPAAVAQKVADVRARAARRGRTLQYGIRLHVIVRETEDAGWAAAAELVQHLDEATVAAAQKRFAQMDSVGQRRMAELNKGKFNKANIRDSLEVSPNLWAGVGLVRGGAGTALVGNPQRVADRINEYAALGLEHFILSGYPHLDEAYRFAELAFPLLPIALRERLAGQVLTGPFGEVVANSYVPAAKAA